MEFLKTNIAQIALDNKYLCLKKFEQKISQATKLLKLAIIIHKDKNWKLLKYELYNDTLK